jgi:hypothetical protein
MNNVMAQLAEVLNIDHAKMPREQMAEAVCEKALKKMAQLEKLRLIKTAAELVVEFAEEAQSDTGRVYVIDADWIEGLNEIIDESAAETNGMAI